MNFSDLPTLNACLNATAATFLLLGYRAIKRGDQIAHKKWMLTATLVSALFLTSYLIYHYHHGDTKFTEQGLIRYTYFTILISHIICSIVMLPFIFILLWKALTGKFEIHRRIARWVWPVWMYVSVTGVLVYLMLYQFFPATN